MHLEESVPSHVRGTTGTFLKNILEGNPVDVEHPRLIEQYLAAGLPTSERLPADSPKPLRSLGVMCR
jgi:hypothetical protein